MMSINFKRLGTALTETGLSEKAVSAYTKDEIETLIKACIASIVTPKEGLFLPPYIDEHLNLVIPMESDPKFWWWSPAGQSIAVTLRELKVSEEVWEHYLNTDFDIPF